MMVRPTCNLCPMAAVGVVALFVSAASLIIRHGSMLTVLTDIPMLHADDVDSLIS